MSIEILFEAIFINFRIFRLAIANGKLSFADDINVIDTDEYICTFFLSAHEAEYKT